VTSFASDTEHRVFRIKVASYGRCGGMAAKASSDDLVVDGIAESARNITGGCGLVAWRNVQSAQTGVVAEAAFQKDVILLQNVRLSIGSKNPPDSR